jgi:hypothetical protein
VNPKGHRETLVASHPGNLSAVKHGAYSGRQIEARAAEIQAELEQRFDVRVVDRLAIEQLARLQATLEAIDRDLSQRGHVDKRGKPNPLLRYQVQLFRRFEAVLALIASSLEPLSGEQVLEAEAERRESNESGSRAVETGAGASRINVAAELEREIRAAKPNAVRVSALLALDRIRRQEPIDDDEDIPGRLVQVFE